MEEVCFTVGLPKACLGEPCSPSLFPNSVSGRRDKGFFIHSWEWQCRFQPRRTVWSPAPESVTYQIMWSWPGIVWLRQLALSRLIQPTATSPLPVWGAPFTSHSSCRGHPRLTPWKRMSSCLNSWLPALLNHNVIIFLRPKNVPPNELQAYLSLTIGFETPEHFWWF